MKVLELITKIFEQIFMMGIMVYVAINLLTKEFDFELILIALIALAVNKFLDK